MDNPQFSVRVNACTRIYYVDVYKDSKGSPYLSISEIPTGNSDKGPGKRQRIFVHREHLKEFAKAISDAIGHIEAEAEL